MLIDAGTRAGDFTQLATKPVLSTGTANVDPNFGGTLDTDSTAIVLFKPLRFVSGGYAVRDKINQALQEFQWEKRRVPVTLVTDGDMLASGTSDWTDSNSTLTKVAASFPHAQSALRVTATAADGYGRTGSIAVEPDADYYLEATGMIGSTGAAADEGTLILYDVTGSSESTHTLNETTIDRFEPEILMNTSVSTGSSVEQVQVWLRSEANGDIIEWSNLIFRKNESLTFTLQDRPVRILDFGEVRMTGEDTWSRRSWETMERVEADFYQAGAGLWELHLGQSAAGKALFYEEFVQPGTLTAVTDTTTIPAEDLAAVAAELLLRPLRSWNKDWNIKYEFAQSRAAGVLDRYWSQNQTVINKAPAAYPTVRL